MPSEPEVGVQIPGPPAITVDLWPTFKAIYRDIYRGGYDLGANAD